MSKELWILLPLAIVQVLALSVFPLPQRHTRELRAQWTKLYSQFHESSHSWCCSTGVTKSQLWPTWLAPFPLWGGHLALMKPLDCKYFKSNVELWVKSCSLYSGKSPIKVNGSVACVSAEYGPYAPPHMIPVSSINSRGIYWFSTEGE